MNELNLDLSNIQIDYGAINQAVAEHFKANPIVLDPEALKSGSVVQQEIKGKTLAPVVKKSVDAATTPNRYLVIGGVFFGILGIGTTFYFLTKNK
jgi:hypothetical protein